jgi:hypothetical protein
MCWGLEFGKDTIQCTTGFLLRERGLTDLGLNVTLNYKNLI